MITVKFLGGAKKSFLVEQLQIEKSNISIEKLLELLSELKPADTPELDIENILVAVNGSDSSAMDGKLTQIKDNDLVSIIPVIHGGGASEQLSFQILKKQIQVQEIKGKKTIGVSFLDDLRKKYPKLHLQAVSSTFVLNDYHLKKILSISLESQKQNVLLSNKIEIDILMRFALTPQISNAIKTAGIKPKTNFVLIAIGNKTSLNSLYAELEPLTIPLFLKKHDTFVKKFFNISKIHLDSVYSKNKLEDVLIEKAATLF